MPKLSTFLVMCVLAALAPHWTGDDEPVEEVSGFPGWPAEFEGRLLVSDSLSAVETEYARDFPGEIARFEQGERVVVMHWVARATRRFHFSRICLQGVGWKIEPAPILVAEDGRKWGVSLARKDGQVLRVRQRIEDADGNSWVDDSAWYWATLLGETRGPWTAWTVAEP